MATAIDNQASVGIRRVSELTGLSMDTLRWYEREGLLPTMARSPDGRRRYPPSSVDLVLLVQALRRTGMPVAEVRQFRQLMEQGAASHGRRMALLERQETRIRGHLDQLHADLSCTRI